MKAISLWQPWASLMAVGAKTVETRGWSTPYRGLLAIAATAKTPAEALELRRVSQFEAALAAGGIGAKSALPQGMILCVVELVDCVRAESRDWPEVERLFGDLSPGRCGWVTRMVQRLDEPIPCSGRQGLWELSAEARSAIETVIGRGARGSH